MTSDPESHKPIDQISVAARVTRDLEGRRLRTGVEIRVGELVIGENIEKQVDKPIWPTFALFCIQTMLREASKQESTLNGALHLVFKHRVLCGKLKSLGNQTPGKEAVSGIRRSISKLVHRQPNSGAVYWASMEHPQLRVEVTEVGDITTNADELRQLRDAILRDLGCFDSANADDFGIKEKRPDTAESSFNDPETGLPAAQNEPSHASAQEPRASAVRREVGTSVTGPPTALESDRTDEISGAPRRAPRLGTWRFALGGLLMGVALTATAFVLLRANRSPEVVGMVPTRADDGSLENIGKYPENLQGVIDLLDGADTSIEPIYVTTDFAGYARFHKRWREYRDAILKIRCANPGKCVYVVFPEDYSVKRAKQMASRNDEVFLTLCRSLTENEGLFQGKDCDQWKNARHEYFEALARESAKSLCCAEHVTCSIVEETPLISWVTKGEAIFAVPHGFEPNTSVSWRTREQKLIEALRRSAKTIYDEDRSIFAPEDRREECGERKLD